VARLLKTLPAALSVATAILVGQLVGACSSSLHTRHPTRSCDYVVYGACVVHVENVRVSEERMKRGFELAAAYWSGDVWATKGWTVFIRGRDPFTFGDGLLWGVTFPTLDRMDFAAPRVTCPEPVFIHEWGHAGAKVMEHDDPRFDDAAINAALKAAGIEGC
jgi:hypothetical protein